MSKFLRLLSQNLKTYISKCRKYSTNKNKVHQSKPVEFSISKTNLKEQTKILSFMWTAHHPDEPIIKGLGLGNKINPIIDDEITNALQDDLSLTAVDTQSGKMAGCAINTVSFNFTSENLLKRSKSMYCKKTGQLFEFLAYIMSVPKLYEKYSTGQIYDIRHVCVDTAFRGQGLGTKLIKKSLKQGQKRGFRIIRANCTSVHVAKICSKLGMLNVFDIPYSEFMDKDEKPIINYDYPNVSCQVFVHVSE